MNTINPSEIAARAIFIARTWEFAAHSAWHSSDWAQTPQDADDARLAYELFAFLAPGLVGLQTKGDVL